jgi:hypothetical protein
MIRRNNKRLYESIMKDVSNTVNKHLNEYEVDPKNYIIRVTAQDDNNNCITIFEKTYNKNILTKNDSFLKFVNKYFPLLMWEFDDGEDIMFTDYIQYVAYPKKDSQNYVLATWEQL